MQKTGCFGIHNALMLEHGGGSIVLPEAYLEQREEAAQR